MIGRLIHTFWLLLVGLLMLFAVMLGIARLWVPVLGDYRTAAEQALGELLNQPVTIDRMDATWRGLNPVIKLRGVSLAGELPGTPLMEVDEVWVGIDIEAYLHEREIRPASIDIIGADLTVIREPDGRLYLDGIASGTGGGGGLSALLRMERLAIHDSRVIFRDLKAERAPLRFSDVTLALRNESAQYSVIGYAMLPPELGYRVDIQSVLKGSGNWIGGWNGRLYLKGQSIVLSPDNLPWLGQLSQLAGVADVRGWLDIKLGRLQSAVCEFDVGELSVSGAGTGDAVRFDRLGGQLGWRLHERGWQLAGQNLVFGQEGIVRKGTTFAVTADASGNEPGITADIRNLNLPDLRLLALLTPGIDLQRQQLEDLRPEGMIDSMELRFSGPPGARSLAAFDAGFRDVGIGTPGNTPVVRRLRGSITGTPHAGALWLGGHQVSVQDDSLFRDVLMFDDLGGEALWHSRDGLFTISSDNIRVANDDLEVQARLTVALPGTGGSPIVDLEADFVRGKVRRMRHYLPAHVMSPKGVGWLDRSLVSGEIEQGSIVVKGRLDQIPYDHGEGVLSVSLPVRNAVLDYSPDWTQITRLDADVKFTGRRMDVHSTSGFIRTARLARVHALIPDLARPDLTIRGRVNGQLDVMLAEMDSSPVGDVYGAFVERVASSGPTGLDLDIVIPLHRASARELTVSGNIHLKGNTLDIRDQDLDLEKIRGTLRFTPDDFSGSGLKARLLGTPVEVDVWTDHDDDRTYIRSRGPLDLVGLVTGQQSALADLINGRSDWDVRLGIGRLERRYQVPDVRLDLSSTLEGIAVNLPAPFGKQAQEKRPLTASITRLAHPDRLVQAGYGDVLQGVMSVEFGEQQARLARGQLRIGAGEVVLPDENLFVISGRLPHFSLARWLPVLASVQGGGGPPVEVDLEIGELVVTRHVLHEVGLQVETAGLVQEVTLSGKSAEGDIEITRTSRGIERVVANLKRLHLGSAPEQTQEQADIFILGPADFPELHISIGKLSVNDIKLGSALVDTLRSADGMEIKQLAVASKMLELRATGNWRGKSGFDRSWLDVEIIDGRLEKLLEAFDYKEQVDRGELSGTINAGWQGAPWKFEPGRAEGKLYLNIRDGRLEAVKPGPGRLFGLISLHSLPRRLSLDFDDIYKKGFSFDRIEGSFVLDGGNAYTDDLKIEGPAARIDIAGRIGLADRDYDQLVTVLPNVSSGLPLAGVLAGGPAVGAALLLAEQLLDDELDEMAVRRYTVTGPWTDPVYEKLERRKKQETDSIAEDYIE